MLARARHLHRVPLLSLCALALVGCEPRTVPTSAPMLPGSNAASGAGPMSNDGIGEGDSDRAEWPFWPTAMRIHPLTRLASDPQANQTIIECRLEFSDGEGQTSKAVGQLTLQVYADSVTSSGDGAMETWNQDLRDLPTNRKQYDDVTRTYLFRLQISQPLPAGCEMRAFFLSADGQRMNAELRLR